ncbi:MAG: hypothetical protein QXE96_00775 [Candidatus Caldarchaeum sp.]|jgi:hypothetical protein
MQVLNFSGLKGLECRLHNGRVVVEVIGAKQVRGVELGYGSFSFRQRYTRRYGSGWDASYRFLGPVDTVAVSGDRLSFEMPANPCTGLVKTSSGVLTAPAAKLDIAYRTDVWMMFFTPWSGKFSINLGKNMLSVSDQASMAYASLQSEDGRLTGSLTVQGPENTVAKLILERWIDNEYEKIGQEIARAQSGATQYFEWMPVVGPPQPLFTATRSLPPKRHVKKILRALGCTPSNILEELFLYKIVKRDTTVADGENVKHLLKLVLVRRLQKDVTDEAEIKVKWT